MKQIDTSFTIRERVIIALLQFLINFIGKKQDIGQLSLF